MSFSSPPSRRPIRREEKIALLFAFRRRIRRSLTAENGYLSNGVISEAGDGRRRTKIVYEIKKVSSHGCSYQLSRAERLLARKQAQQTYLFKRKKNEERTTEARKNCCESQSKIKLQTWRVIHNGNAESEAREKAERAMATRENRRGESETPPTLPKVINNESDEKLWKMTQKKGSDNGFFLLGAKTHWRFFYRPSKSWL